MTSLVLTEVSAVSCDHPVTPGGGPVTLSGAATGVLKVEGHTVLAGTLAGAAIGAGCAQTGANQVPCATVGTQDPGSTAQVLKVDGEAVLIEDAGGLTNEGVPDKAWSAKSVNQTVLRAD